MAELTEERFLAVVRDAPLVSIDLLVRNPAGALLVGKRINEPAVGSYFVPGGRIRKGESLEDALARIANDELGLYRLDWHPGQVEGVYTHLYETNALNEPDVPTHYVVIAYRVDLSDDGVHALRLPTPPDKNAQHSEYRWLQTNDLDETPIGAEVHSNTKAYFVTERPMTMRQYEILNARRDVANSLVWQTPVVGLTALAFIFIVLLSAGTSTKGREIAAFLAIVVCAAVVQLTVKHRWTERTLAVDAYDFEVENNLQTINRRLLPADRIVAIPSVYVWIAVFVVFALAAVAVLLNPGALH